MESNPSKCYVMVFGGSSANERPLKLYGEDIPFTDSYKYVGGLLSSKGKLLFKPHYQKKAQAGRIAAVAVFSLSSTVGPIDPINGKKIYLAQIDPQLTAASAWAHRSTHRLPKASVFKKWSKDLNKAPARAGYRSQEKGKSPNPALTRQQLPRMCSKIRTS
ncbi:hypothetical protein FRC00_004064 [Tulasnella sp. 408]|nr:hypothetical protein FRC00_004064 [Tulasnella sp. 408]